MLQCNEFCIFVSRELQLRTKDPKSSLVVMRALLELEKRLVMGIGKTKCEQLHALAAYVSRCIVCTMGDAIDELDLYELDESALELLVKDVHPIHPRLSCPKRLGSCMRCAMVALLSRPF